jgi:NDP-mannose synthase
VSRGADLYRELLQKPPGSVPSRARAVILAGGRGTRLAPYTSILPKPLMPIGDRAILELVVDGLAACDITDITLSVGHLAHLIQAVLEDGNRRGVAIEYVHEDQELGTAGPLRLVDRLDETFLVMNGDLLTTLDYRALLETHQSLGNHLTIAAHRRSIKIDYGVLHVDSDDAQATLTSFDEKPELSALVSMGIYAMEPELLELIPRGVKFDIPDLIREMLERGMKVGTLLHPGMWFDIGRHEDYEAAVAGWLASSDGTGTATQTVSAEQVREHLGNGASRS